VPVWPVTRALAVALLLALLALAGVSLWGWSANTRLTAAEALVRGYAEAVELRRRQDANTARLAAAAARLDTDLDTMEGGDAPLSDYLVGAAGRLWAR